jgi:predicted transcriptional regulator with HTH domain
MEKNKKRENRKPISEEMKKKVLNILIYKPKTLTQMSRELKKDISNVSSYLRSMKDLVAEEELKVSRGRGKLLRLKKKGYNYLGISQIPKISSSQQNSKSITKEYINEEELEILNQMRLNGEEF